MLFTELKKINRPEMRRHLEASLRARGLDPALLEEKLGGEVAVEELLTGVLEDLLDQAAENTRENFRARQRRGLAKAQTKGIPVGRPSQFDEEAFAEICRLYERKELTGQQAANRLGIARGTFYRWMKEHPAEE